MDFFEYINTICEEKYNKNLKTDVRNNAVLNSQIKGLSYFWESVGDKKSLKDIDDYIDENYTLLYDFIYNRDSTFYDHNSVIYFYRGVSNNSYPIAPGIFRKSEKHDEFYYFNEIQVRCPEVFRSLDNLEKLTYMQHYGCPTRLVDVTTNPLVALFFACSAEMESEGSVYVFRVNKNEVCYSNSDKIQMLAKLPELKKEKQYRLRNLSYFYSFNKKYPQKSNRTYSDEVVEKFYHIVERDNNGFTREMIPFDLLKPQFVLPKKDNPRILKQDGAFIISGVDLNENESDMKIRKYLIEELKVSSKKKKEMLRILDSLGINQATLFPEVEKVAAYLKGKSF